jgi:hypothetical protein
MQAKTLADLSATLLDQMMVKAVPADE